MASSAVPVRHPKFHVKYVLFSALLVLFVFVLWIDERFVIDHTDPTWAYYFPVRWLVLVHALGGLTALVLGPFQLSRRFRQRHLRAHRIMGRFYLTGVLIAGSLGMYISYVHQELPIRLWIFALAPAWLITGAMAFVAVRNRHIEVHRQWMIRNYALTTIFVTQRVLAAIPFIEHGGDTYIIGGSWLLLVATLLIPEVGLSWHSVFKGRET
jgi:uncharacterized membrane protein